MRNEDSKDVVSLAIGDLSDYGSIVLCLLVPPRSDAAVALEIDCGDVVGPGRFFTATDADGDMDDCVADPALTIIGPVTVDLGTIEIASNDGVAILIDGTLATVRGGHVTGSVFDDAVVITGNTRHTVSNMEVEGSDGDGMVVESNLNKILNNYLHDNSGRGISNEGMFNLFTGNRATDNGEDGFEDEEGSSGHSTWISNVADNNGDNGFDNESSNNRYSRNTATNNGDDGFDQDRTDQTGNLYTFNTATDNGDDGFEFDGDQNIVNGNVSNDNDDDGFDVSSDSNNNGFVGNRAAGNGDMDAEDNNAACDANSWRRNRFGTTNQACVR